MKFFDGGWFPVALGLLIFTCMSTWARGRALVIDSLRAEGLALDAFVAGLRAESIHRAERTAVYLSTDPSTVPQALLHNLKHNQVLHRQNVVATVVFRDVPWVEPCERVHVEAIGTNFWRVRIGRPSRRRREGRWPSHALLDHRLRSTSSLDLGRYR